MDVGKRFLMVLGQRFLMVLSQRFLMANVKSVMVPMCNRSIAFRPVLWYMVALLIKTRV